MVVFLAKRVCRQGSGEVRDVLHLCYTVHTCGGGMQVAFWLGIDWLIQLPLLFAFAARGSLLNTYLGVKYGTMLKWHRCALASPGGLWQCMHRGLSLSLQPACFGWKTRLKGGRESTRERVKDGDQLCRIL